MMPPSMSPPRESMPPPRMSMMPPRDSVAPRPSVAPRASMPPRESVAPRPSTPPRPSLFESLRPSLIPRASVPAVALASMLLTQGCYAEMEGGDKTAAAQVQENLQEDHRNAEIPTNARGIWVWGVEKRLKDPNAAEVILETCRHDRLNEVYISVAHGVLKNPKMAELVKKLYDAGIRVEALMGDKSWYMPEHRHEMTSLIEDVIEFNAANGGHIAAIHLDIEPHQYPENRGQHAWLPQLAETIQLARAQASSAGMSTSADLPRFAFDEQGPMFAKAAQRPFVMLYQLRERSADWLALQSAAVIEDTYIGANPELRGRLVVSLRVEDYGRDTAPMAYNVDQAHGGNGRYGGFAIHDEARLRAAREAAPH